MTTSCIPPILDQIWYLFPHKVSTDGKALNYHWMGTHPVVTRPGIEPGIPSNEASLLQISPPLTTRPQTPPSDRFGPARGPLPCLSITSRLCGNSSGHQKFETHRTWPSSKYVPSEELNECFLFVCGPFANIVTNDTLTG